MMVLSSVSFKVYITHAHAGQAVHTHVSRVLDVRDIDQHHDTHHGHHDQPVDSHTPGPSEGDEDCGTEEESTRIASGHEKLIRHDKDLTLRPLDMTPIAHLIGAMDGTVRDAFFAVRARSNHPSVISARSVRCCVLLI